MFGYKLTRVEKEYLVVGYPKVGNKKELFTKSKFDAVAFFCKLFENDEKYFTVRFEQNGKDILDKVLRFLEEDK